MIAGMRSKVVTGHFKTFTTGKVATFLSMGINCLCVFGMLAIVLNSANVHAHRMGYLAPFSVDVDPADLGSSPTLVPRVGLCILSCASSPDCTMVVYGEGSGQCWTLGAGLKEQLLNHTLLGTNVNTFTAVDTYDTMCTVAGISIAKDCPGHYVSGGHQAGLYPMLSIRYGLHFLPCHMQYYSPGWTVIQRRVDGSVNFDRGWQDYKAGFGDPDGSLWLGLENIYNFCMDGCELFAYLVADPGNQACTSSDTAYAHYTTFTLADETNLYRQTISGYSGTAGDGLRFGNGMSFSTPDRDNDIHPNESCAAIFKNGWWFSNCHSANPNGAYLDGVHGPGTYAAGMDWRQYRGYYYSMRFIEIRVKTV